MPNFISIAVSSSNIPFKWFQTAGEQIKFQEKNVVLIAKYGCNAILSLLCPQQKHDKPQVHSSKEFGEPFCLEKNLCENVA